MLVETYYDAYRINGEIYIINPKNGMVQCVTAKTPTGEELSRITEEISEERKKRGELAKQICTRVAECNETLKTAIEANNKVISYCEEMERVFYYGV